MKPLSVLIAVNNNIRRYLYMTSAVIFGIMIMYFFTVLMGSIPYGMDRVMYEPFKTMSIIEDYDEAPEAEYGEVMQSGLFSEKIYIENNDIIIDGLIGGLEVPFISFGPDLINRAAGLFDIRITEGVLPGNNDEILVHQLIATQLGIRAGDLYGSDVSNSHMLRGTYEVCGVFSGDKVLVLGFDDKTEEEKSSVLLVSDDKDIDRLNKLLEDSKSIDSVNLQDIREETEQVFQFITYFSYFVMVMIVCIITVIIRNISYINFYDRMGEIALIRACGNSRRTITVKLVKEMGLVLSIGGVLGLTAAVLGCAVFNAVYCVPKGIMLEVISVRYIALSAIVILSAIVLSIIPISKFIKKTDIIEVLDGNY